MHKRLMAMKQNLASAIEAQLCNIGEVDCEELGCAVDMLKDLEEALYFCTITEAMNGEGKGKGNVEIEYEHKKNGHSQMNGSDQMYYPMYANGGSQMYMGGSPMMYANGSGGSSGGSSGGNSGGNSGGSSGGGGGSSYYGGNGGGQSYYGGGNGQSYYDGGEQMYYQSRDSQGRFTSGRGSSRSNYSEPMMMERDEREGRSPMNRRMYMEAKGSKDKATQLRELEKYMQELTGDMVEMIQDASSEEKQYLEKKISALASKIGQMK